MKLTILVTLYHGFETGFGRLVLCAQHWAVAETDLAPLPLHPGRDSLKVIDSERRELARTQ